MNHPIAICSTLIKCKVCRKPFRNERHLAWHEIANKTNKCKICRKRFCDRTKRDQHELAHEKQMPKCTACEKGFKDEEARLKHLKCHKEPRRFKCKYCKRDFSKENEMVLHERNHQRRKPLFNCNFCGKSYSTKYSCEQHEDQFHIAIKIEGRNLLKKMLVTNLVKDRIAKRLRKDFEYQSKAEAQNNPMAKRFKKGPMLHDAKVQEQKLSTCFTRKNKQGVKLML